MKDRELEYEDYKILFAFSCALVGLILSFYGMFFSGNTLAIALPLWIFSTVYITKDLTYEFTHDIVKALDVNK